MEFLSPFLWCNLIANVMQMNSLLLLDVVIRIVGGPSQTGVLFSNLMRRHIFQCTRYWKESDHRLYNGPVHVSTKSFFVILAENKMESLIAVCHGYEAWREGRAGEGRALLNRRIEELLYKIRNSYCTVFWYTLHQKGAWEPFCPPPDELSLKKNAGVTLEKSLVTRDRVRKTLKWSAKNKIQ